MLDDAGIGRCGRRSAYLQPGGAQPLCFKADITEEIVRLGNHLKLFRGTLDETSEIGKKLDFITQEMNREANTIASKSPAFQISQEAVNIKSEIEKIKEQVQNIE